MKKSKLILLALVGLFFFNSCKDEDPVETKPSTEAYETVAQLKSMTGISITLAKIKLEALGYFLAQSLDLPDNAIAHNFIKIGSASSYHLYESKSKIYSSEYYESNEKTVALNLSEKYSKECIAYTSGKSYEYIGFIKIKDEEESEFTTIQEFETHYLENKLNLENCFEGWHTTKERITCSYYDYNDINISSGLTYTNRELAPVGQYPHKNL